MYVQFNSIPNEFDFQYRDATLQENYYISIATPLSGTYYIGIFGYSACSYQIQAVTQSNTCPSRCSAHGVCNRGVCQCDTYYSGDSCETYNTDFPLDSVVEGFAGDNTWNYYHVTPNTANNLKIEINQEEQGDCDLYVKSGSKPSRIDYDYRDITYNLDFSVVVENPGDSTWYVGIYGYRACPYHITMSIDKGSCPNDCSNHGSCTHDGRCDCDSGWAGKDCASPLYHLSNGVIRTDSVLLNQWNYYSYRVPEVLSSLTLTVAEQSTVGEVWVYIKKGAPPDLTDYDIDDTNISSRFHVVYEKTDGSNSETSYYIGVYANPLSEISHQIDYSIIAYSPSV
jgi:hypothetical protein